MSQDSWVFLGTDTDHWQQRPHPAADLQGIQAFIEGNRHRDTYITPNTFKDPTTNTKDNIATLRTIVVDLDDHWQGMTVEQAQALVAFMQDHFNHAIPTPYRVVYTGRGVHYYVEIAPSTNIALYDLVARGVLDLLDRLVADFNAMLHVELKTDKVAINGNRLFRCEGTYNTKAGTYARGIYASGSTYTLDSLIDNFMPDLQSLTAGKTTAQAVLDQRAGRVFKQYRKEFTALTWRYAAIDDLKALQTSRNNTPLLSDRAYKTGDNANAHMRNTSLFYYGLLCKHAFNDTQEVLDSMAAFNAYYGNHAKSDREVLATYHSVMTHNYNPPSAAKIIDNLSIDAQEMQALKVLIDKAEVKRRTRKRVAAYKATKARGRAIAKQSIKAQAQAMHAAGASYRAIAKTLDISLGYAHKLCN